MAAPPPGLFPFSCLPCYCLFRKLLSLLPGGPHLEKIRRNSSPSTAFLCFYVAPSSQVNLVPNEKVGAKRVINPHSPSGWDASHAKSDFCKDVESKPLYQICLNSSHGNRPIPNRQLSMGKEEIIGRRTKSKTKEREKEKKKERRGERRDWDGCRNTLDVAYLSMFMVQKPCVDNGSQASSFKSILWVTSLVIEWGKVWTGSAEIHYHSLG